MGREPCRIGDLRGGPRRLSIRCPWRPERCLVMARRTSDRVLGRVMSVEVLLIPLGIAAYGALATWAKESRSVDLCEKCKATRVMQTPILVEALTAMSVVITSQTEDRVTGTSKSGAV